MHIKIFFNDKPLFLCDALDEVLQPIVHQEDVVFIDELNSHTIKTIIHEMQQPQIHAGVFFNKNLNELKKELFKKFIVVPAAGGLIINEKKQVLLIYRRGKWDLPKGKLEKGESPQDGAVREVKEETGLLKVKTMKLLTLTYHTYHEGARMMLKESHWFLMRAKSDQKLTPQKEEDIVDIRWANRKDIPGYLLNSFASVIDVIQVAFTPQ